MNWHHCQVCSAQYSKDTEWVKGLGTYVGTESEPRQFVRTGYVPKNVCPICLTPNNANVVTVKCM